MNKEAVFVLEPDAGRVTVEISQVSAQALNDLASDLGRRTDLNCAKPADYRRYLPVLQSSRSSEDMHDSDSCSIWLYRLYHNSVVDGPGRRSVIQTAGCSIRCGNCFVPQTHERGNGNLVSIASIVKAVVS